MDNDDYYFYEMESKLKKISEVLKDPYKSIECKYSLVEDIMAGIY